MRFDDLKTYLLDSLVSTPYEGVDIFPGPYLPQVPGRHLILTPTPGPGLNTEDLFDAEGWQVRAVGEQHDYNDAEALAEAADVPLRSENSKRVGGLWIASMTRQGSKPYPLFTDDAERTHFVCSYYLDVQLV